MKSSPNKSVSPLFFFLACWISVIALYSLDISYLLIYSPSEILFTVVAYIITPFLSAYLFLGFILRSIPAAGIKYGGGVNLNSFDLKLKTLLLIFFSILAVETALEGYVPIFAMAIGRDVSHLEYGIRGVHGLVLALGGVISTISFLGILKFGTKAKYLAAIVAVFVIFILYVTRKMIVVSAIQMFFCYLAYGRKFSTRLILISLFSSLFIIYIFGFVGDIRNGREIILTLSRVKFDYPEWMPSGFIWVYIYITTPILNYVNAINLIDSPAYDFGFICPLIPGMAKEYFGCKVTLGFDNIYQVSSSFNVATGYISIFESLGNVGVIAFGLIHGAICRISLFLLKRTVSDKWIIINSIIMQSTVLMVFTNGFLTINVAAQLPIAYFLLSRFSFKSRLR